MFVEHYCKLGTPTAKETFDAEFEKEINAWAEANVGASEREEHGSDGLQRVTREDVNKCVAKLKNRKAAGANKIVNAFMNTGEKACLPLWLCCIIGYGRTSTRPRGGEME